MAVLRFIPGVPRCVGLAVVVLLATVVAGCSDDPAAAPAPTGPDALRIAAAMEDPVLLRDVPFVDEGQLESRPYVCDDGTTCQPATGEVRRRITRNGAGRLQVAKLYIDKLPFAGWYPDSLYCDPGADEYVVLAARNPQLERTYPGRLEIRLADVEELVVTVPAHSTERDFTVRPADADYPTGPCPERLTKAMDDARALADQVGARGVAPPTSATAPPASP